MKKQLLLVAVASLFFGSEIFSLEVPNWQAGAEKLLKATDGLADTLSNDANLYKNRAEDLDGVSGILKASEKQVKDTLGCLEERYKADKKALAECKKDTAEIEKAWKNERARLLAQYDALIDNSEKAIKELTDDKKSAEDDYAKVKDAYEVTIGQMEVVAKQLMDRISDLDKAYESMVKEYTGLESSVDSVVDQVANFNQSSSVKFAEAENAICFDQV